jgi:SAM-dependent methyltransferase
VAVGPDDAIVDVGCGKGRSINWFLDRYPGNRIVGIELDPQICADTAKRLRRHANVTIVCGDATAMLPADGTVFYLFNPFDESVMRRFARAMLDRGKPATIVYLNAKHVAAFEDEPRFTISPIDPPGLSFRSVLVTVR